MVPQLAALVERIGGLEGILQVIGPIMIDIIGPIEIPRGDSLTLRITVTDDADAPIDITGFVLECQVKPSLGAADPPTIALAVGTGIVLLAQTGATLGQADITFTSVQTDIADGLYWLDVVTVSGGVRTHVIRPRAFVVGAVVNAP